MTDETFERAARMFGDMLYRVAYHALKNRADAEDVVQTVLLKLYQKTDGFESEEHLKHWLLRVTVNESRKLLRSFWRRRAVPLEERDEGCLESDSWKDEVFEAVMALDAKYRLSIYLYYYEGCSVKEAAAAMGVKPSTVQTWLQRARDRLRKTLSNEEEEEGNLYVRPKRIP
ncbi:RNA polymerase sigma factor [Pseudoflavonifractor phocaeensis]|uniref:RNA polymerase sigma factor n=1 Tax=Pseudoflavonifractor phocaeensis TaxID=1870988 RepID=UPI00195D6C0E|nr:sigma-70 family RNA polymerase sigma factor [Pseudoflavonifractor phocaeensis]MBM6886316.1 sigma-70 family RNA polymerase sigma factor [Pseudoflavonifractor phocaeensis]